MGEGGIERAVFLADPRSLGEVDRSFDRLYFGNETCPWRLPTRRELRLAYDAARGLDMAFTLVTPLLDDAALGRALALLEELDGLGPGEVIVNDVGLLEEISRRGWEGEVGLGRLLTRQRRGAGWKRPLPGEEGAADYLRRSSLESEKMVAWMGTRYGVRRFEIDDLPQGVRVGDLPGDVRLSLYRPFAILTVTRLCPWNFDGRRWRSGEGCGAPCREGRLVLNPGEGGAPILMGGCAQFLKVEEGGEADSLSAVDRLVIQPGLPA